MTHEEHRDIMARLDTIADRLSDQITAIGRELSTVNSSASSAHKRIDDLSSIPDRLTGIETACRIHRSQSSDSTRSRAVVVAQVIATVGAVLMSLFAVIWKR